MHGTNIIILSTMKNLFKSTLIIAGMLLMSNSSCQKDSIDGIKTEEFNLPFEINLNGKVILPKSNSELMIEFVQLADSRCPTGVQCVWAGNALVNLILSVKEAKAETALCLGQCKDGFRTSDTTKVSLNNNIYSVILQEVKPYPEKEKSENKKVVLVVKKG